MAQPIEITDAIIQYAFIDRVNPVSNKFSFSALIPWDENCPQCQAIVAASNSEWAKVSAGAKKAQSMGYTILAPNDATHIHADVMKMLDPTRYYLQVRAVQDANTTTPIELYDTVPQAIQARNIVGNGTIAKFRAVAYGYDTAGQKGVKFYGQWLQILSLVENTMANTGPGSIEAPGGYVADAAALTPSAPVVQQAPAMQQQAMPAANVMPAQPAAIPGTMPAGMAMAPAAQPAAIPGTMPAGMAMAPAAQPAAMPQQAYAAPAQVAVQEQVAPAAMMAPAPAAPIAPVGAAPMAPVAPMMPAPGMPQA